MSSSRTGSGGREDEPRPVVSATDVPTSRMAELDANLLKGFLTRFPEASQKIIEERVRRYEEDLIQASLVIADRSRSSFVSPADVERAFDFLNEGRAVGIRRHFGLIGGTLLGAGLSSLAGLFLVDHMPTPVLCGAVAFSVVGAFLIAKDR